MSALNILLVWIVVLQGWDNTCRCYCPFAFYDRDILPKENLTWQKQGSDVLTHTDIPNSMCMSKLWVKHLYTLISHQNYLSHNYLQKWDNLQPFSCDCSLDKIFLKYLFSFRKSFHQPATQKKVLKSLQKKNQLLSNMDSIKKKYKQN